MLLLLPCCFPAYSICTNVLVLYLFISFESIVSSVFEPKNAIVWLVLKSLGLVKKFSGPFLCLYPLFIMVLKFEFTTLTLCSGKNLTAVSVEVIIDPDVCLGFTLTSVIICGTSL